MLTKNENRIELVFLNTVKSVEVEKLLERYSKLYDGILDWTHVRLKHLRVNELQAIRNGQSTQQYMYCTVYVSKHVPINWLVTQLQAQPEVDTGMTCHDA